MITGFQEFFRDLATFFKELTSLCSPRAISNGFTGLWRDIRTDHYRKIPLLLTVAFHLGVLAISIITPFIMNVGPPKLPEVYTVNLYKAPEEAAPPPPAPEVVKVTAPAPKKEVATPVREKVVVATKPVETEPAPPPPVPREKISLSPIRQRLEGLGYLEERAEKEMAKAESVAEQAEQAAVEAKKAALARIAEGYRSSDQSRRNRPESTGTGTDKGGPNQQELEALDRYGARLRRHISPHWQLPELQEWDEDLRAVIVIQVNRDGTVTGTYFEKRSRDSRFNRYVQKAVDNAQPLPPFPIDFHKKSEEIGVTFSPGGLF
ncbi:MAG: TonB C-terminal domain-containing protein [Desulfobulbaceae bacterium]|nr:TonB C-terminal domain-containing protein [Desulfobulbaceae bacterium]